jgi:hypothetical protein
MTLKLGLIFAWAEISAASARSSLAERGFWVGSRTGVRQASEGWVAERFHGVLNAHFFLTCYCASMLF